MNFLLKLAGLLKILFILNIFILDYWRKSEFHKAYPESWGSFTVDIESPWYFYIFLLVINTGYLFNIVAVNSLAFLPETKASKFLLKRPISRIIYLLEVVLLLAALFAVYNNLDDVFSRPRNILSGQSIEFFAATPAHSSYETIAKLEVINYSLPILSAIIILVIFWKFRGKCIKSIILYAGTETYISLFKSEKEEKVIRSIWYSFGENDKTILPFIKKISDVII